MIDDGGEIDGDDAVCLETLEDEGEEAVGRADVESWGGRVVRLREVPGVRTTRILERLARP